MSTPIQVICYSFWSLTLIYRVPHTPAKIQSTEILFPAIFPAFCCSLRLCGVQFLFSRSFVALSSRPACTRPQAGPRSPRNAFVQPCPFLGVLGGLCVRKAFSLRVPNLPSPGFDLARSLRSLKTLRALFFEAIDTSRNPGFH